MADLWDRLRNLFRSVEESSPSNPAVHELIRRSDDEQQDYSFWKDTLVRRRLQNWLSDQYALFLVTPDDVDDALDFLDTPSSKGFVVYFFKTQYSQRDVQHFFDYLKERVLDLGYRTQISDTRTFSRPKWVETVERHYLKPPSQGRTEGKFYQEFGNITIENHLRDEQVHYLKFRATIYKDHQFHEAKTFQQLMQEVLL